MTYDSAARRRELRQIDPEWLKRDREYHAEYLRNRRRTDPDWRERTNAYQRQRFADAMTDPGFRAKRAAYWRQYRAKKKAQVHDR